MNEKQQKQIEEIASGLTGVELDTFRKAEKLTKWDGPVYWDGECHRSMEDMIETMEYIGQEIPKYCHVTKTRQFVSINITKIKDEIDSLAYEDWDFEMVGWKEVEAAIEKFNAANRHQKVYECDDYRVVLIDYTPTESDQ